MVELGVRRHWPNEVIVCVCVCMTECIWSGGVKGMRYQGTWTLARKLTKSGACGGIEWLIKLVCVCVCSYSCGRQPLLHRKTGVGLRPTQSKNVLNQSCTVDHCCVFLA